MLPITASNKSSLQTAYLAREKNNCKVIPAIDGDMLQVQVQCRDNNNTLWRQIVVSLSRWFNYIVSDSGPVSIESVLTALQKLNVNQYIVYSLN